MCVTDGIDRPFNVFVCVYMYVLMLMVYSVHNNNCSCVILTVLS